jgi:hypothetical protein
MANNYDINYEDSRFQQVETDKQAALNEIDQTYGSMIGQAEKFYDDQVKANQDWADKQAQLQNERTDFEIQKIEQQKEQTRKDYLKEQSGAYVDWQKQSNQYGANAEQMAASGLKNTGYSESSQVAMYNTYQNRVATARASLEQANTNYDNAMTEARLQNNSILAELAYNTYKQQLELALQGFQYQNQLILEQSNRKAEAENNYYSRYLNVLNQINTENAMAEEVRQYNEKMAEEKRQYNESLALQQAQLEEEKRQFNEQMALKNGSQSNDNSSGGGDDSGGEEEYLFEDEPVGEPLPPTRRNEDSSGKITVANSPWTLETIAQKEAIGEIETVVEDGKIWVVPASDKAKGKQTLDKQTGLARRY